METFSLNLILAITAVADAETPFNPVKPAVQPVNLPFKPLHLAFQAIEASICIAASRITRITWRNTGKRDIYALPLLAWVHTNRLLFPIYLNL
jgi:hypothetical protein